MPLLLCFRGGAVRFSFFLRAFFWLRMFSFGGLCPFGYKFLFIQKKKKKVQHPGLSDHCPLVTSLNIRPVLERRKNFPFKFFNFWADHPTFLEIVKEAWTSDVLGTPMYKLTQKLKRVKASLKAFNFHSFGKLCERVVEARKTLEQAQTAVLNNPTDPVLLDNERKCLKMYHDLAYAEQGFLKQKSRVQWLKL